MKNSFILKSGLLLLFILMFSAGSFAGNGSVPDIGGIRLEFIIFGATLVGVALFHKQTMWVALAGLALLLSLKLGWDPQFDLFAHIIGHGEEEGEWKTLLNLTGLLFGFAILARIFEESRLPELLPKFLPNNWTGGLMLLLLIMILSSFLDNIAAAILGGTIARVVFKNKLHIGYLAAIVAASNAGGAGSVVGDTTTTLMWIDGVHPLLVTKAFIASIAAFLIFGFFGSKQQHKLQPISSESPKGLKVDWMRIFIVFMLLVFTIITNYMLDMPAAGVWAAILVSIVLRPVPWGEVPKAFQGTIFLLSLVTMASMMPVDELPAASWQTSLSLGFVSAVFDNIPLTKLCLVQGGYDWGILAYAVGFGGSMIWFGSSAGVALSNLFPEAKSVGRYVKAGWHVTVAYVVGFFIMLAIGGWHPVDHKAEKEKIYIEHKVNQHGKQ